MLVSCTRCHTQCPVALAQTEELLAAAVAKAPAAADDAGGAEGDAAAEDASSTRFVAPFKHKGWCPSCKQRNMVLLRAELIHERNPSCGYLDTNACTVVDLLPSTLLLSCAECHEKHPMSDITIGRFSESYCHKCHTRFRVGATGFRFVDVGGGSGGGVGHGDGYGGAGGKGRGKRARRKDGYRITPGKPLPEMGTCKHYARSKRWLRFPCCGRAYACDVCHDSEADHVHEVREARNTRDTVNDRGGLTACPLVSMLCGLHMWPHCATVGQANDLRLLLASAALHLQRRLHPLWQGCSWQGQASSLVWGLVGYNSAITIAWLLTTVFVASCQGGWQGVPRQDNHVAE